MPVYPISEGNMQRASQAASTDITYSYVQVPLLPAVCSPALLHAESEVPPPLQVGLQESYGRGDRQSSRCPSTTWSAAVFPHGHAGDPPQWVFGSCMAGVNSI